MISIDLKKIHELLNRDTIEVLVKADLEKKLLSGKQLNVKFGIDPSGSDLHIGHMVIIRKLKEFQDLGHNVILLFGNFTGQIGDPTGKSETRKIKTQQQLEENAKHYIKQAGKILDINKIQISWNADWLSKLNFADIISLASNFTVAQMLERDMFQERIKKDQPISVHEFMYPLMQGYDSVALKADVELGGTDQTFNLLAGRTLQRAYNQTPQDILTMPILEGTDGKLKMGKSSKNYIGVNDEPKEMFGKIMSIPDKIIVRYFELATNLETEKILEIKQSLDQGENPRNLKIQLAKEIVSIYHDQTAAIKAENEFIEIFSNKGLPDIIETKVVENSEINIIELLVRLGLVTSRNEARRAIEAGSVKINGEKVKTYTEVISLTEEKLIQVGKRKFLKVKNK